MFANTVQSNAQSDETAGSTHAEVDPERNTNDNLHEPTTNLTSHIGNVRNFWVAFVKLKKDVCRVGCEDAEADDSDDAGNDAESLQGERKTEDSKANLILVMQVNIS